MNYLSEIQHPDGLKCIAVVRPYQKTDEKDTGLRIRLIFHLDEEQVWLDISKDAYRESTISECINFIDNSIYPHSAMVAAQMFYMASIIGTAFQKTPRQTEEEITFLLNTLCEAFLLHTYPIFFLEEMMGANAIGKKFCTEE